MAAKYVTPAELAERWICSPDYIRKLIDSHILVRCHLDYLLLAFVQIVQRAAEIDCDVRH